MLVIMVLFIVGCGGGGTWSYGNETEFTTEPEVIVITQEECLELFGNSSVFSDYVWYGNAMYYIRNEPIVPYRDCEWYSLPMMTNQPFVWTPCFEQEVRKLIYCNDDEQYTLSIYFDRYFSWVTCQHEEPLLEAE